MSADKQDIETLLGTLIEKYAGSKSPGDGGWGKDPKASDLPFAGVSVPIKIETPRGSLKCHLALPPEVLVSEETLMNAIRRIVDMGFPVDFYQASNGNGWGRGGGGNGWNGNRGGGGGYNNGNGYGGRRGGW